MSHSRLHRLIASAVPLRSYRVRNLNRDFFVQSVMQSDTSMMDWKSLTGACPMLIAALFAVPRLSLVLRSGIMDATWSLKDAKRLTADCLSGKMQARDVEPPFQCPMAISVPVVELTFDLFHCCFRMMSNSTFLTAQEVPALAQ
ncbi:MAG: hypothetical protein GY758_10215 [Fuerstiella sp.]|nr:hypothetical protein [Fuerstiella sp.]